MKKISDHCCKIMKENVELTCEMHKDNMWECPDKIIFFDEDEHEYGIIIHNGGTVFMPIQYCPWCGRQLSKKIEY